MWGGVAYVLMRHRDLYMRLNKSLVSMDPVTEKHDIAELRASSRSTWPLLAPRGEMEILTQWTTICRSSRKSCPSTRPDAPHHCPIEEKGMDREQAEVEAFYLNTRGGRSNGQA